MPMRMKKFLGSYRTLSKGCLQLKELLPRSLMVRGGVPIALVVVKFGIAN